MARTFSRRRYLVDWNLQGNVCAHGLLYGCLGLATIVGGIFLPLLWDLGDGRSNNLDEQAIVMLYMHDRLWLLALACAAIVAVSALRMSHRIAGPLVRYKRNLRLVAQGKLPPPLRTRRGDYLKEEVVCLNAAVAGIAERVDAIRRAQAAVRTELSAVLADGVGTAAGRLEALAAAGRDLERAVAAISTCDPGDDREPAVVAEPAVALAGTGGGPR